MKANIYESAVIINAALDDEQIESVITRIKELIVNNGGKIRDIENWGRKRLAYMIKKNKIGYYVIFRFNAPPTIIVKLDRAYSLDEHIIRYLNIILDKNAVEFFEEHKTAAIDENKGKAANTTTKNEPVIDDTKDDLKDSE